MLPLIHFTFVSYIFKCSWNKEYKCALLSVSEEYGYTNVKKLLIGVNPLSYPRDSL